MILRKKMCVSTAYSVVYWLKGFAREREARSSSSGKKKNKKKESKQREWCG